MRKVYYTTLLFITNLFLIHCNNDVKPSNLGEDGLVNSDGMEGVLNEDGGSYEGIEEQLGEAEINDVEIDTPDGDQIPVIEVVNLGETVNSILDDIDPSISSDGKYLFYASNSQPLHPFDWDFDIYVSANNNSGFETPRRLNNQVNFTAGISSPNVIFPVPNQFAPSINVDTTTLYFSGIPTDNIKGLNILVAQVSDTIANWQNRSELSLFINSRQTQTDPFIHVDGTTLFYATNNDETGQGLFDIWMIADISKAHPSPLNLGTPINSFAEERGPHLTSDGAYLYFSSNRPGGFGGHDIYRSAKLSKGWDQPENLGPEINGPYDDRSPSPTADGKTLYFCSSRPEGFGGFDIWKADLSRF